MKRTIGTYFAQYFKMPHLYRDDLDRIESVIQKVLKPARYSLSCAGMEFKSVEAMSDEMDHADVLVISTQDPCVRLKFARSWAELYSGDSGEGVRETLKQVGHIVAARQRLWLWRTCKYASWLAPLVGFGSLSVGLGLIALGILEVRALYLIVWLLGMSAIWWAIGHRYTLHGFSKLDFRQVYTGPTLLERVRGRLLTFAAGAVFGAFTLWVFFRYLTHN